MIMIRSGLLLMFLSCVWTLEYGFYGSEPRYSLWPSVHNALIKKRDVEHKNSSQTPVVSEGGFQPNNASILRPAVYKGENNATGETKAQEHIKQSNFTTLETLIPLANTTNSTDLNTTLSTKQLNLNNPGVFMRSMIVFGGFLMLAVAYYIFYKIKGKNNESSNEHNTLANNQFRYGFLQSEDRRDNVEFGSRVPLTLETDDDDEDDDMEIFDMCEKKKSLSYVNLETNDEDVVFQKPAEVSGDDNENILLDIEDVTSDPLINWSYNGNKSIL